MKIRGYESAVICSRRKRATAADSRAIIIDKMKRFHLICAIIYWFVGIILKNDARVIIKRKKKRFVPESTIDSAAAVAGSGASVLRGVKADLYLTGEMSHHDVLDAVHNGVTVVLANHSNTEREYLNVFAGKLRREMPLLNVRVSEVDRDPLLFV